MRDVVEEGARNERLDCLREVGAGFANGKEDRLLFNRYFLAGFFA